MLLGLSTIDPPLGIKIAPSPFFLSHWWGTKSRMWCSELPEMSRKWINKLLRLPRKLNFGMQPYSNQTRWNIKQGKSDSSPSQLPPPTSPSSVIVKTLISNRIIFFKWGTQCPPHPSPFILQPFILRLHPSPTILHPPSFTLGPPSFFLQHAFWDQKFSVQSSNYVICCVIILISIWSDLLRFIFFR